MKLSPDTALRAYLRNKDRFADFMNAGYFQGKQVLSGEILTEKDSDVSQIMSTHEKEIFTLDRYRDVIMEAEIDGQKYLYAIECQKRRAVNMVWRDMNYDYSNYYSQVVHQDYKRKLKLPLIRTMTLYSGESRWKSPLTLHELAGVPYDGVSNDWKLHLCSMRHMDAKLLRNEENRKLVEGLQIIYAWGGKLEGIKDMELSREVAITLVAVVGKKELLEIIEKEKGERISMCRSISRYGKKMAKQGHRAGQREGIQTTLLRMLDQKLNGISKGLQERIVHCGSSELMVLVDHIFTVTSEKDVLDLLN